MFSLARAGPSTELVVDNDAAFDRPLRFLEPVPGEVVLASLRNVVDVKGGANEAGPLFVTNLRVVWFREVHPRTNLSAWRVWAAWRYPSGVPCLVIRAASSRPVACPPQSAPLVCTDPRMDAQASASMSSRRSSRPCPSRGCRAQFT